MANTEQRAPLAQGARAPDFRLPSGPNEELRLADLRGRPAVLAFYPADWSPVCSDQLVLYQEVSPLFEQFDARVLGISVDSVWCHRAFREHRGIRFPLLSDFEPKGADQGVSERALFVLDAAGAVHWSYVSPPEVNPGADGILHALEDLSEKGAAT